MAEQRKGDWMQTYTGKAFWPLDPRPDEVDIEDIAHALSLQCRYAGHCRFHYSVAQHSVLVMQAVMVQTGASQTDAIWGLLHDAAEAYLVDLPRPVKREVQGYVEAENRLLGAVAEHFGLTLPIPNIVHRADNAALLTEKRDLMEPEPLPWGLPADLKPWLERIPALSCREAEHAFLQAAKDFNLRGASEALRRM